MKKIWLLLLALSLLLLGSGCGLMGDSAKEGKDKGQNEEKTKNETNNGVAKIKFGDYPRDENNWEVLNQRKHFGKEEEFSMSVKFGKKIDTTRVKVKIVKQPDDRLIQEWVQDEESPDSTQWKWMFTDSGDFHGFYELGDYTMQLFRGEELLAEGSFTIVD
ncbi:hypothetical protein [Mechercharimyces sp. CAU 1602]|uniref:hypothetical protein n=1 Tax=Mechercharimyces sp. CAU 1602 TaxID=2973933 RepID=UPI0021631DE5|nr:hypothetical protein [Mechercharimyces sp. CAU 1602]MCS1352677.1 hypothetical protein [Mechercharimyces sp. CAU 1602]